MADLLSHLLLVFAALTILSWWIDGLRPRWIVIAMGGAAIPDLAKVRILVEPETVEQLTGLPFSVAGVSTLGGVVLVAGTITVWFERDHWLRVYSLLVLGGSSALLVDGLRAFADGRADAWLFPFLPAYRPPTPSLYVSADPLVPATVVAASLLVVATDRWIVEPSTWFGAPDGFNPPSEK